MTPKMALSLPLQGRSQEIFQSSGAGPSQGIGRVSTADARWPRRSLASIMTRKTKSPANNGSKSIGIGQSWFVCLSIILSRLDGTANERQEEAMETVRLSWAGVKVHGSGGTAIIDALGDASPVEQFMGKPATPLVPVAEPHSVDAALVTHMHPDHWIRLR